MMKPNFFQITMCCALLGVMSGAALIHALQVLEARGSETLLYGSHDRAEAGIEKTVLASSQPEEENPAFSSYRPDREVATLKALEEIVDRLQELKSANHDLRDINTDLQEQLRETNRDLNELQFRVDTHSESFRPLRVSSNEASLLWNSISPGGNLHPLLPPKK